MAHGVHTIEELIRVNVKELVRFCIQKDIAAFRKSNFSQLIGLSRCMYMHFA